MAANFARRANSATVYVNLIGGQDELVFDGGSFVVDGKGNLLAKARHFSEDLITIDMMLIRIVPDDTRINK